MEEKSLDIITLCKLLLKNIKIIILSLCMGALLAFLISKIWITPMYSSSAMLYVENKQEDTETVNQTDIDAAQKLAKTCAIIFTSDTVMEKVASDSMIEYTAGELSGMITVASVDSTEVMQISVDCTDPDEANHIISVMSKACISEYNRVIKSGTITQIEDASKNNEPSSPNIPLNTIIGALLGIILSCSIIIVRSLLDTTVKDSDDLSKIYDIPVFAEVSDLESISKKKYSYNYNYN